MAVDLTTLLATKSADTLTSETLVRLGTRGFPVTAWQTGGVARTLVEVDTAVLADLYVAVQSVAGAAFLELAIGAWLTLYAKHRYQVDRTPAQFATGSVRLTCASGSGPYTIQPGRLLVSDGTRRFVSTNTSALTVPSGSFVDVTVRAEVAGTAGNVPAASGSSGVTIVVSPALAGVTCTNSAAFTGGDREESDASLRARCVARWGSIGFGSNDAAYVFHATDVAHTGVAVTRARVGYNTGSGGVTVYVAKSGGTASTEEASTVRLYVDARNPLTDTLVVTPATAVPVAVTGTIYVRAASDSATNRARATDAITAYFAELAIGESVDEARLKAAIYSASGITDVDLFAPTSDTAIADFQVATLGAVSLSWVVS